MNPRFALSGGEPALDLGDLLLVRNKNRSSAVAPISQTTFFIDPQNVTGTASDGNSGATSGTALFTWAQAIQLMGGTFSPLLVAPLTVTFLSAQSAGADPIFFTPKLANGAQAILLGTLVPFSLGAAAGTVTPKSIVAGGGTLLQIAGMPGGTTKNMWVVNANRGNSAAYVDSMSGTTAVMQQPMTAASYNVVTSGTTPTPTEDNTWATGDTLNIYAVPLSINLKEWRPTGGDVTLGGQPSCGWVQSVQIADPSGAGLSSYQHWSDGLNALSGCVINPRTHVASLGGRGGTPYLIGNSYIGAVLIYTGGTIDIYGGGMANGLQNNTGGQVFLGNDVIVHGAVTISGSVIMSSTYSDGTWSVGVTGPSSIRMQQTFWGPASLTLSPGATFWNDTTGAWVNSLLISGAIKIGTNTTGTKYLAGAWTDGIGLTAANMDTNLGLQDPSVGARFCNAQ